MVVMILIAVGAATLGVLIVLLIGLSRHVVRLATAVADFQKEVQPILEEIRTESQRAGSRAERVRSRGTDLRRAR